jgi:hypothetical protein
MSTHENAAFLVFRHADDGLVGVFNITNIVRGAFQSGYLGYYVFAGHERQGLMRNGLEAVVRFAFQDLELHRLEANPADQHRLDRACESLRLSEGRVLTSLPENKRALARSRAMGRPRSIEI